MILDRRVILAGLAAIAARPAYAQQPPPATTELRNMFDAFVSTVEQRFYRVAKLRASDFRTKADLLWPEIKHLPSPLAAAPMLNGLLAELKTSHTQVFTSDEPEFFILADVFSLTEAVPDAWAAGPVVAGIGVYTSVFAGRVHITMILERSPADRAGLQIGDEIVSVDGAPFRAVASFRNRVGETVRIAIRRRERGEIETIVVPVRLFSPNQAFDKATLNSARVIEHKGRRIGYVHLWQFQSEDLLAKAIASIDTTRVGHSNVRGSYMAVPGETFGPPLDSLIVDNRAKVGGNANVVKSYMAALAAEPGGAIRFEQRGNPRIPRPPVTSLKDRCAMLVDGGTRSAGELFAFSFKSELGPLFGTTSAGAVSGGQATVIAPGVILYVAVSRVTINGVDLEGVGVVPTHIVARPIPYSAGADPVLDAALEHLTRA